MPNRNQIIQLSDLARGFAGLSTGTTRRKFQRRASALHRQLCEMDGPIPADIAAMTDAQILAELRN